jgi:hypothetical protein
MSGLKAFGLNFAEASVSGELRKTKWQIQTKSWSN